jgi:hypothetical protein
MRLSHDLPCRLARLLLAITLALIWAGADRVHAQAPAASAASGPTTARQTPEQRAAAAQQLRNSLRAIEQADRDLPGDSFDVAAVVKSVGYDPAKLIEGVRDQTEWGPNRGSQRGEVGGLMDP